METLPIDAHCPLTGTVRRVHFVRSRLHVVRGVFISDRNPGVVFATVEDRLGEPSTHVSFPFSSARSSTSLARPLHRSILSCLAPRFLPLDACSGRVSRRRGRTCFASHFDPFGEEGFEGGDVHDLILRWLGTVDHELVLWAFATCSWSDHRGWMQHEGVSDWYVGRRRKAADYTHTGRTRQSRCLKTHHPTYRS